jgi:hypothetical protein
VKESFRLHLDSRNPKSDESVVAKWGRELCRWCVEGLARPSQIAPFTLDAGSARVLRKFIAGIGESSEFADVAVMLLTMTYKLYEAAEMPSDKEFRGILGLRRVSVFVMTEFVRTLLQRGRTVPLFRSFSVCEDWLAMWSLEMIAMIFGDGFYDVTPFISAVLYSGRGVLDHAAQDIRNCLGFVSSVIVGLHRAIVVLDEISPSAALSIIEMLPRLTDRHYVRMVLPPAIRFVEPLLNSAILTWPVVDIITNLLQQMRENSGGDDIRQFVESHRRERTSPSTRTETQVWETTHDYADNMDEVRLLEYPFAVKFVITFDPDSCTEDRCDFLEIFTDSRHRNNNLIATLTGNRDQACWRHKYVFESCQLVFRFFSDSSVHCWGYRAAIQVTMSTPLLWASPPFFYYMALTLLELLNKKFSKPIPEFLPYQIPIDDLEKHDLKSTDERFRKRMASPAFPPFAAALFNYLEGQPFSEREMLATTPLQSLPTSSPDVTSIVIELTQLFGLSKYGIPQPLHGLVKRSAINKVRSALSALRRVQTIVETGRFSTLLLLRVLRNLDFGVTLAGKALFSGTDGAPHPQVLLQQFFESFISFATSISPRAMELGEKAAAFVGKLIPLLPDPRMFIQMITRLVPKPVGPNEMIPFLSAAVESLHYLPDGGSNEFAAQFIIQVLRLNHPCLIARVLDVIEAKALRLTDLSLVAEILQLIGRDFVEESKSIIEATAQQFDLGPSFSFSRAHVLRSLITDYDAFCDVLKSDDPGRLGLLIVLSLRFLEPFRDQKVRLRDGSRCRILSTDAVQYKVIRSDGIRIAFPAFDPMTFSALPLPFGVVPIERIGPVSSDFIQTVFALCDHKDKLVAQFATFARAEISDASLISYAGLLKQLQASDERASHWIRDPESHEWRFDRSVESICFSVRPGMTFGFVTEGAETPFQAFYLWISADGRSMHFGSASDNNVGKHTISEPASVRVTLYGPAKQVVVQTDSLVLFTKYFLGYQEVDTAEVGFEDLGVYIGESRNQ